MGEAVELGNGVKAFQSVTIDVHDPTNDSAAPERFYVQYTFVAPQ